MTEELRRLCRELKPLIGEAADSLWMHYQLAEVPAARIEAENTIRMMAVSYLGGKPERSEIRLPPMSSGDIAGEIYLGDRVYPGRKSERLGLHRLDFTKHLGIFATTGSGKTNVVFHLIRQFMKKGIPFLVIDWKRSYRNLLILEDEGIKSLRVFTVGRAVLPFEWNPLRPPPKVHPQTWIQVLSEVLEKSHVSGQGVADVIAEHADAEFSARGFYDNRGEPKSREYPNFYDLLGRVERSRYGGRRALWRESCLRILRTFTFGPAASAFNARNPVHLEDLLSEPVVLELDLEMPKTVRSFFTEVILRWIHLYRLGQGESARLRHVLIMEEVHNIFPMRMAEGLSQGGLENVYREIRSFGQGLIAITQHPSLLPIFVLGNTHTLVFMALTHEADIIAARQSLFLERTEDVFLDRLKVGEGIVKIKGRIPSCHVRFPEVKVVAGSVLDDELRAK